jgi:hypothetical protein
MKGMGMTDTLNLLPCKSCGAPGMVKITHDGGLELTTTFGHPCKPNSGEIRLPDDEVERVAIAISPWYGMSVSKEAVLSVWEHLGPDKKEGYRAQARAAIKALRLPEREHSEILGSDTDYREALRRIANGAEDPMDIAHMALQHGEPKRESGKHPLTYCTYLDNDGARNFNTDFVPQVIATYEMEVKRNEAINVAGAVYNAMETALNTYFLTRIKDAQ